MGGMSARDSASGTICNNSSNPLRVMLCTDTAKDADDKDEETLDSESHMLWLETEEDAEGRG